MLVVATAATVLGSLNASIRAADTMIVESQATDLAVTLLSEIQLGVLPLASAPATPYDAPLEDWTWQVVVSPAENMSDPLSTGPELQLVEVIVTHTGRGLTFRLAQLLPTAGETADGFDTGAAP